MDGRWVMLAAIFKAENKYDMIGYLIATGFALAAAALMSTVALIAFVVYDDYRSRHDR